MKAIVKRMHLVNLLLVAALSILFICNYRIVSASQSPDKPERTDYSEEIIVGFYEETAPLAFIDKNGEYGGAYVDILKYIRENSGLNIKLYAISRDEHWQELLKSGVIDFYFGASVNMAMIEDDFISTDPFIKYRNVLITRNDCAYDSIKNPVIALTYARNYYQKFLPERLGNVSIVQYRTAKDCMIAVQKGEIDGLIINNYEYNYQSKNSRFSHLISWESYRFESVGGLIASVNIDEEKFDIVNTTVNSVSKDEIEAIIMDYLNMPYSYNFLDTLFISRWILLVIGIIVLAVIIIWSYISHVNRRQKKIEEEVQKREKLHLRLLGALGKEYDSIYFTDLKEDITTMVAIGNLNHPSTSGNSHSGSFAYFVNNYIVPEYREEMMPLAKPTEIIRRLKENNGSFMIRYQMQNDPYERNFFEIRFVDVSENDEEHLMASGVRCIDNIVLEERRQQQLIQDALDAANRANNAKSDFLSRMSHDIRTPMNAIMGLTAIAAAHLDQPERIKDALNKITSSSSHLLGLINDVLDMSKIESGVINLSETSFNLSELLDNVLAIIQPHIKEHEHTLDVHVHDIKHEDVIGDNMRLQQAFVNILSNAVKYTPNGGKISITVIEKPTNNQETGCYEFIFEDNGIGMSKEFLAHIFEPFTREEDDRTSRIQGTGLGMAITHNFIRMMNGNIDVKSEQGKGSVFTITVFLKLQHSKNMDVSKLAGLSVAVIDNDRDVCESVCIFLDEIGMKSTGFHNGKAALDAIEKAYHSGQSFHAAVLDWKMPDMDGVEMTKAIRKIMGEELSIIILSSYDWSEIEDEARAAGVNAFLEKPVFKSNLIHTFNSIIKGGKSADANAGLNEMKEEEYKGRRILLVEDNELNREIAREILEMSGFEVEEAVNGKIAVDMLSESEKGYYDLIFMDIQMPVMNGYEASRMIRTLDHPDAKKIPIIAMTANAFSEDIRNAKSSGMNGHISKPIDIAILKDTLKKYLS